MINLSFTAFGRTETYNMRFCAWQVNHGQHHQQIEHVGESLFAYCVDRDQKEAERLI